MSKWIQVAVHPSQFPGAVLGDLRESLRARRLNHKFLYESYRQAQKWLAVQQAYSPARNDAACRSAYEAGFAAAARRLTGTQVHVISLGCGGGQKDVHLLGLLRAQSKAATYTPVDVSTAMVLAASQAVAQRFGTADGRQPEGGESRHGFTGLVCDLLTAEDLAETFAEVTAPGAARLITFLGMIPNFEPDVILPKLKALLRTGDSLLFSANLAPGQDYAAGVRHVLYQYNNALTTDWLQTVLLDLGVERTDGTVVWRVEPCPVNQDLLRIAAYFRFIRSRLLSVAGEKFDFRPGDTVRLFFSYRYTPERVHAILARHGLAVVAEWLTPSQEEGVFLLERQTI